MTILRRTIVLDNGAINSKKNPLSNQIPTVAGIYLSTRNSTLGDPHMSKAMYRDITPKSPLNKKLVKSL